jgi:uncharacterized protein (DUF433 family)
MRTATPPTSASYQLSRLHAKTNEAKVTNQIGRQTKSTNQIETKSGHSLFAEPEMSTFRRKSVRKIGVQLTDANFSNSEDRNEATLVLGGPIMNAVASVIQRDPDILGGTPIVTGTRVPIRTLLDYLAAGDSLAEFLDHFPTVSREQAVAALEQANNLLVAHANPS